MSLARTLLRPCLQQARLITRSTFTHPSFSSSSSSSNAAAETPPPSASTSTSTSTPKTPKAKPKKKRVLSECLPGTQLTGLNILKGESDPIALPDDEYTDWLWTILDGPKSSERALQPRQVVKAGSGEEFDFERERKRLRAVNKAKIKADNFLRTT